MDLNPCADVQGVLCCVVLCCVVLCCAVLHCVVWSLSLSPFLNLMLLFILLVFSVQCVQMECTGFTITILPTLPQSNQNRWSLHCQPWQIRALWPFCPSSAQCLCLSTHPTSHIPHHHIYKGEGRVFGWEIGFSRQIGDGLYFTDPWSLSVLLTNFVEQGDKVIQIGTRDSHSIALMEAGKVYVWDKPLGNLFGPKRSLPVSMDLSALGGGKLVQIAAGDSHAVLLTGLAFFFF